MPAPAHQALVLRLLVFWSRSPWSRSRINPGCDARYDHVTALLRPPPRDHPMFKGLLRCDGSSVLYTPFHFPSSIVTTRLVAAGSRAFKGCLNLFKPKVKQPGARHPQLLPQVPFPFPDVFLTPT